MNSARSCLPSPPLLFAVSFKAWLQSVVAMRASTPGKHASQVDLSSIHTNDCTQVFNQLEFPILHPP